MIDIHCHMLPGIDDGAQNLAEALDLARLAVANGIATCVATPHIHPGRYDNDSRSIQHVWQRFRAELEAQEIPLVLHMAAEVRLSAELLSLIADARVPFLGTWQERPVLLLELPHSEIPPGTDKFIAWLKRQNIQPLIAHPERNKAVIRDPSKIEPFVDMGCLLQLTAASVTGDFGEPACAAARYVLKQGWAFAVATDAHNVDHRPPMLDRAYEVLVNTVGESAARTLCELNPAALLAA